MAENAPFLSGSSPVAGKPELVAKAGNGVPLAPQCVREMCARQVPADFGALDRHRDRLGAGTRQLCVLEQCKS